MNGDVYNKISERMKQENFTDEEIKAVQKAKDQLSSYTTAGSALGAIGGIMLARSKKFKGFQAMALATGAFLIGSQVGMLFGAMASLRTIQSIPNFQRVLTIVQDVREQRPGPHGPQRRDQTPMMPPAGNQRLPAQHGSEMMSDAAVKESELQGFASGDGYHGGNDPNNDKTTLNSDSAWANVEQRVKELQQGSNSWAKIRQENMPKSAWTRIRQGNIPQDSENKEDTATANDQTSSNYPINASKRGGSSWDRIRQQHAEGSFVGGQSHDGSGAFPRTREDLESNTNRSHNKYGDAL
ncbi:hypothetical protein BGW42_005385 [Actinomortierella wolfii]|nr:hypothetical protein BGW42_005385 [Actinomortierella wolfii]